MQWQNPDPEAKNIFAEGIAGTIALLNGTGRTRYDILKELNASPEQQKEMRQLVASLYLNGMFEGMLLSVLVIIAYLLITKVI